MNMVQEQQSDDQLSIIEGKEVKRESDDASTTAMEETGEIGSEAKEEASSTEDKFRMLTVEGKWEEVIKMCDQNSTLCTIMINKSRGTALHVAANEGNEEAVSFLVETMVKQKKVKDLKLMKNEREDTPLHLAATRGLKNICECIIGKNKERKDLITVRNGEGETPIFQSALLWPNKAFLYLCSLMPEAETVNYLKYLIRTNGDSILHCAIRREFFDLAIIILKKYPKLYDTQNIYGFSPLKVLATRPSAFKSGRSLTWWNTILYHCVYAETLDVEKAEKSYMKEDERQHKHIPHNYDTCNGFYRIFKSCVILLLPILRITVIFGPAPGKEEKKPKDPEIPEHSSHNVPENYVTCLQIMKLAYVHTLGISGVGVENLRKMKQNHIWSRQLLSEFMKKPYESYTGSGGQPSLDESVQIRSAYKKGEDIDKEKKVALNIDREETVILVAARNGIVEMVNEILSKIPSAIHETNSKKKNVLLVAVENRQPLVVEALKNGFGKEKKDIIFDNLKLSVDEDENTVLHLAAAQADEDWLISGAALQMMWHIKWFQYIKGLMPEHFENRTNKEEKTAGELFRFSLKEIRGKASDWLKDTSESCSVVAALLAGVSFATSTTVPGGVDTATGKPALEGKPAFQSFTMCSLLGLCFSVTALVMFLSILTSRKEIKDFRVNLPLKVLLGLSCLFISITALFATFCSAHFFVIDDSFKEALILIYAFTCLPVTFYAIAQFPLYIDLIKAIATKVPSPRDKGDDL